MDERKKQVLQLIAAAVLLIGAWAAERLTALPTWGRLLLYLPAYLTAGYEVLLESGEKLLHGQLLDEDFLMSAATLGALALAFLPGGQEAFAEAVFVMLFFQLGELLEALAGARTRSSVTALMDLRPDAANLLEDGAVVPTAPEQVAVGAVVLVQPGERIPLDGVCLTGASALDTSSLTGESLPQAVQPGDALASGCINLTAPLTLRVTHTLEDSTTARILRLVEEAQDRKSRSERFLTRFARIYTPAVVGCAAVLAILPPLLGGGFAQWLRRALTFLVVSCPCALVVSVPLAYFCGIGGAARQGILVKGGSTMDALCRVGVAALDKTGTLTDGAFQIAQVRAADPALVLELAARAEAHSTHPISAALREGRADGLRPQGVQVVQEAPGRGVTALVDGRRVICGTLRLMQEAGITPGEAPEGTVVHVAADGAWLGCIQLSDRVKPDAAAAIRALKSSGVAQTVLLTGDHTAAAQAVGQALGLDQVHAGLLPQDKAAIVEQLLAALPRGKTLLAAGDGVNDAPVLARADVGVAMGALGADAAIEAADVVVLDDRPARLPLALGLARRTRRIAWENIVFALAAKLAVLALATLGLASMGLAVFADVGVMVLAVANAARALKIPKRLLP